MPTGRRLSRADGRVDAADDAGSSSRRGAGLQAFPLAHGVPIHIGDPVILGICDLNKPDFGDPVEIRPGETPVFWACGVTPQAVALAARLPLLITHKPGHMFVTDLHVDEAEK